MITKADVAEAAARIAGRVRQTPVIEVDDGTFNGVTLLKLEFMQHSGSFKARGVFNRILAAAQKGGLTSAGVLAASGGNAGLAVAYAARVLDIPAEIYGSPRVSVV